MLVFCVDHCEALIATPPRDVGLHQYRVRLIEVSLSLTVHPATTTCERSSQFGLNVLLEHVVHVEQEGRPSLRLVWELERALLQNQTCERQRGSVALIQPSEVERRNAHAGWPWLNSIETEAKVCETAGQGGIKNVSFDDSKGCLKHAVLDNVHFVLVVSKLDGDVYPGATTQLLIEQESAAHSPLGRLMSDVSLKRRWSQRRLAVERQ